MGKPMTIAFKYPASKGEMPVGPYADAGVLVEVNAGWRVVRPVIDADKCVKCQKCWFDLPRCGGRSGGNTLFGRSQFL